MYLPGRNIVLLGKAGVYCAASNIDRLVLGTLAHNPFPDATPAFRAAMAETLSLGLAHQLTIDAPYANFSKADVIRRGVSLGVPMDLTLSCMNPVSVEPGEPREPGNPGNPVTVACAANAASGTTRFSRRASKTRPPTSIRRTFGPAIRVRGAN